MNATEKRGGGIGGSALSCLTSAVMGLAATMVLLVLVAILVSHGAADESAEDAMILVCTLVGGCVSGIAMRLQNGAYGALPMGAVGGGGMALLVALITALRASGAGFDAFSVKLLICGAVGGVIGGVAASGKKRTRKSKRKK